MCWALGSPRFQLNVSWEEFFRSRCLSTYQRLSARAVDFAALSVHVQPRVQFSPFLIFSA
jgi:hypothetical protein